MHSPPFHPSHTLGDWPECWLEARCAQCGKVTIAALKTLGVASLPVLDLITRLRCGGAGRAVPVYLCAAPHRTFHGGPRPEWAIELVLGPN
jgi:hypothetical protein